MSHFVLKFDIVFGKLWGCAVWQIKDGQVSQSMLHTPIKITEQHAPRQGEGCTCTPNGAKKVHLIES